MEKILQFGEGNFLRAFAEEYINDIGERVAICQPRTNTRVINALKEQGCEYDIIMRGRMNGEVIDNRKHITCVSRAIDTVTEYDSIIELFRSDDLRVVISNTTEAGIAYDDNDEMHSFPMVSYPAKITYLLHERWKNGGRPLIFLPAELIDHNGDRLRECVLKYGELWGLGGGFAQYVGENHFCNTMVDRIVTGHIESDDDACSVACEPYRQLVLQCDDYARSVLPQHPTIIYTDDLDKFKERKVKILNGSHTMSVPAGYMMGYDIVRDMVNDDRFRRYINMGISDMKETIDMDSSELDPFADSVLERFNNPYIDHKLMDISLNSVSKFKARVLPGMMEYYKKNGAVPNVAAFSMAALIAFYAHTGSEREYNVRDDAEITALFDDRDDIVRRILSNTDLWDEDLTEYVDLADAIQGYYDSICGKGIAAAIDEVING